MPRRQPEYRMASRPGLRYPHHWRGRVSCRSRLAFLTSRETVVLGSGPLTGAPPSAACWAPPRRPRRPVVERAAPTSARRSHRPHQSVERAVEAERRACAAGAPRGPGPARRRGALSDHRSRERGRPGGRHPRRLQRHRHQGRYCPSVEDGDARASFRPSTTASSSGARRSSWAIPTSARCSWASTRGPAS